MSGAANYTIILIRPTRNQQGWEAYESEGVRPFYMERQMAIDYAKTRTGGRRGEIQVFNAAGELEITLPFDERFKRD
jgi:hypothetical protein